MEDKKEHPISEESMMLWDKYQAAGKMRDILVKIPFKFKKARKCALDAETFKRKFWGDVRSLYPELNKHGIQLNENNNSISVIKEEK